VVQIVGDSGARILQALRLGNAHVSIFAGTMDGDTGLRLETQIHTGSKGDYYDLPDCRIIDQSSLK
jgi:hypothetical protein